MNPHGKIFLTKKRARESFKELKKYKSLKLFYKNNSVSKIHRLFLNIKYYNPYNSSRSKNYTKG